MAAAQQFNRVADVNGDKDGWNLKVKVMLLWKQFYKNNTKSVASLDIIFIDNFGDKIQATIKKNLIADFEDVLEEGGVFELSNFGVVPNAGNYLLVEHQSKINFYKSTRAKRCQPFENDVDGLFLVPFVDILNWNINARIAFDVVGHLVKSDDMKVNTEGVKESRFITFVLQDLSGNKLNCALWDDFANQLFTTVNAIRNSSDHVIVMIRMAKVKDWQGKPQVSNSLFGTRLYINADVKPVKDYKNSLLAQADGANLPLIPPVFSPTTIVTKPEDYYGQFKVKTIDEVRELGEPIGCVILAKVIRIQKDVGWYYNACRKCGKKVEATERIDEATHPYKCTDCGDVADVYGRIRLQLRVQDDTGSTFVVLFEKHVTRLINRSSSVLMAQIRNDAEEQVFPECFDVLLGKTFVLKIQISEFNLENNYAAFTVNRLTDDENVIKCIREKFPANEFDTAPPEVPAQVDATKPLDGQTNLANAHSSPAAEGDPVHYVESTPTEAIIKRRGYEVIDCEDARLSSAKFGLSKTETSVESLKIPKMEKL